MSAACFGFLRSQYLVGGDSSQLEPPDVNAARIGEPAIMAGRYRHPPFRRHLRHSTTRNPAEILRCSVAGRLHWPLMMTNARKAVWC